MLQFRFIIFFSNGFVLFTATEVLNKEIIGGVTAFNFDTYKLSKRYLDYHVTMMNYTVLTVIDII